MWAFSFKSILTSAFIILPIVIPHLKTLWLALCNESFYRRWAGSLKVSLSSILAKCQVTPDLAAEGIIKKNYYGTKWHKNIPSLVSIVQLSEWGILCIPPIIFYEPPGLSLHLQLLLEGLLSNSAFPINATRHAWSPKGRWLFFSPKAHSISNNSLGHMGSILGL